MKRPATRRTLQLLLVLVAALTWNVGSAEALCGTYTLYRHIYTPQGATSACSATGWNWVNGTLTATTNVCPNIAEVVRDTFDCETNALKSTNSAAALICPCDPNPANAISLGGQGTLAAMPNNTLAASTCTDVCPTLEGGVCEGKQAGAVPVDPACGDEADRCTSSLGTDGFPVNLSSGRVETKPIEVFSVPTPDGIDFGWTLLYGSDRTPVPAAPRTIAGTPPLPPTQFRQSTTPPKSCTS